MQKTNSLISSTKKYRFVFLHLDVSMPRISPAKKKKKNRANRVNPSWNGNDLFIRVLYSWVYWVKREGAVEMSTLISNAVGWNAHHTNEINHWNPLCSIDRNINTRCHTVLHSKLNYKHVHVSSMPYSCRCWFIYVFVPSVKTTTRRIERIGESDWWMRKWNRCICQIHISISA